MSHPAMSTWPASMLRLLAVAWRRTPVSRGDAGFAQILGPEDLGIRVWGPGFRFKAWGLGPSF